MSQWDTMVVYGRVGGDTVRGGPESICLEGEASMSTKKSSFKAMILALGIVCLGVCLCYLISIFYVTPAERLDREGAAVMGHLDQRGLRTTIYGGRLGTYYTVRSKDGKTLARRVPERQLRFRFWSVHRSANRGYANVWALF